MAADPLQSGAEEAEPLDFWASIERFYGVHNPEKLKVKGFQVRTPMLLLVPLPCGRFRPRFAVGLRPLLNSCCWRLS